jgi:hypothetical protein
MKSMTTFVGTHVSVDVFDQLDIETVFLAVRSEGVPTYPREVEMLSVKGDKVPSIPNRARFVKSIHIIYFVLTLVPNITRLTRTGIRRCAYSIVSTASLAHGFAA